MKSQSKKIVICTLCAMLLIIVAIAIIIVKNSNKIEDKIPKEVKSIIEQLYLLEMPENGRIIVSDTDLPQDDYAKVMIGIELNSEDYDNIYKQLVDEGYYFGDEAEEIFYSKLGDRKIKSGKVEVVAHIVGGLRRKVSQEFKDTKYTVMITYDVYLTEIEDGKFEIWLWSLGC